MGSNRLRVARQAVKIGLSLSIVAAMTVICRHLPVNATTVGFGFLIAVLLIATAWGLAEAVAASIAAMLCYNWFFLPPIGTLTISDPQNWIALFAFVSTAIVGSNLSARAKRQALAALERQKELGNLYALSRAALLDLGETPLARSLSHHIAEIFGFAAVALYDARSGEIHRGGPEDLRVTPDDMTLILRGSYDPPLAEPEAKVAVVRLGNEPVGALAVRGSITDAGLEAIANLAAIGLERARSQEAANRADAARQSEEFKSTLLDALAHEFKTPLTSIKAAAGAALASPVETGNSGQRELLTIIEQEADRLGALVTEAIQMARIEAGRLRLQRRPVAVADVLHAAVRGMGTRLEETPVEVEVAPDLPPALLDGELVELAVRQLLDNAAKYARGKAPVSVRAGRVDDLLSITVADSGPGIPRSEQAHIFGRFYRGQGVKAKVPGSGIGLAIVRDIVDAHGGRVWVESSAGHGTTFHLELPLLKSEVTAG